MRSATAHISGQFIFALAQVDDVSQQTVRRPFDIADLDNHFGPYPMHPAERTSGDPNRVPRGGGSASGIFSTPNG